jgi:hypothetical protein
MAVSSTRGQTGMAMTRTALTKPFIPEVCHLCGRILHEDTAEADDLMARPSSSSAAICVHCERSLVTDLPHSTRIRDLLAFVPSSASSEPALWATLPSLIVIESRRELRLPAISLIYMGRRDDELNIYPHVDLTYDGAAALGVSRNHARIHQGDRGTYIEDLNSTNGTFVNGLRLYPSRLYPLDHGDMLRLGKLKLVVKFPIRT